MEETKNKVAVAKQVVLKEARELLELEHEIGESFSRACDEIISCSGKVIITGIGKSGLIGRKIAATFTSTGTPATFMHAAEACHGDIGLITKQDILIIISYSGEATEIINILPAIKRHGITTITMTGNQESTLAVNSDIILSIAVKEEACPMGLAPTSSTTKTLVIGDALAVTLLELKNFKKHDFALSHPSGTLGKKLLLKVSDLMHSGDKLPLVAENTALSDALVEMSSKRFGVVGIASNNDLKGIFTDGDLRRTMQQKIDIHKTFISEVMTKKFKHIGCNELAASALSIMQECKITALFVLDKQSNVLGIIHVHDIISAGLT